MQYLLTEEEYKGLHEKHKAQVRKMCLAHVVAMKRRCPMREKDGICDECAMDEFCHHLHKVYYSD